MGRARRVGPPLCSFCQRPSDRANQRVCKACHSEYQKKWRANRVTVSRETFLHAVNEPPIFVYVIAEVGGEYCKVGVAGSPEDRMQLLRPGNGRELKVFRFWQIPSRAEAFGIERIVLNTYHDLIGNGEWIKASAQEVADFCDGFSRSVGDRAA